jgi:hypothetical protein
LYAQIILVLAVVIAVRPLREVVVAAPWRAAALTGGALIVLLAGLAAFGPRNDEGIVDLPQYYPQRGLPECLSLFALGWMLRLMQGRRQVAITLGMAIVTVMLWTHIDRKVEVTIFLSFALAMLALAPSVTVQRPLGRWINRLASVTLFVYLLHMVVLWVTMRLPLPQIGTIIVTLVSTFGLSLLVKRGFDLVDDRVITLSTRSRQLAED